MDAAEDGVPAAGPSVSLPRHQGSMLARDPSGSALWVADEDQATLRRLPLPLSDDVSAQAALQLPGPVAQVLPLPDGVLATVREPGLLVKVRWADGKLAETARAELPADAWGVAVTADVRLAVVTSAS